MKRVTGIGDVFFKSKDTEKLNAWYKLHLGIDITEYRANFAWGTGTENIKGNTAWNLFKEDTKYFEPSTKEFMINYTVDDLEALVVELRNEGVTILDELESYDYGKFIHILDIEENKIELWEPIG